MIKGTHHCKIMSIEVNLVRLQHVTSHSYDVGFSKFVWFAKPFQCDTGRECRQSVIYLIIALAARSINEFCNHKLTLLTNSNIVQYTSSSKLSGWVLK